MKKWILLLLAAFVLCPYMDAAAQGRYQATALDSEGRTLKNTTVRVCDEPATGAPCTPVSSVFTDSALTNVKSNPFTTDGNGQFFFYAASGLYHIQITSGSTIQTFPDVLISDISGVLGGVGTTDAILFVDSTGSIGEDPTQFCWDDITNRVGIGNCSPTVELDVTGAITASGAITSSGTITGGAVSTAGIVTGADFTWTGATLNVIPFIGASGVFTEDPTNFCFDNSTNRLGVGTCSPSVPLHVIGGNVTFDNQADFDLLVSLIAGDTIEKFVEIQAGTFGDSDIGGLKWGFVSFELTSWNGTQIILANTTATTIKSSGIGDPIRFRDFSGNLLFEIANGGSVGNVTATGTLTVDGVWGGAVNDELLLGDGTTMQRALLPDCDTAVIDSLQYDTTTNAFSCDTQAVTEDSVLVGNATTRETKVLPDCSTAVIDSVQYNTSTNSFSCDTQTVTNDTVLVGNGTTLQAKVLPNCSTAVIDSVTYNTSSNTFGCNVQVVTNHTVLVGTGSSREPSAALADCNTTGDAVTYDQAGRDFICDRHQIIWRAGVYEITPATSGTQDNIPLPVPNQCATNITVEKVTITALTKGSGAMTFNVNRFLNTGAAASPADVFTGGVAAESYANGGNNRQEFTADNTGASSTDFFRINVNAVNAQADVTFIVEGKCDAL